MLLTLIFLLSGILLTAIAADLKQGVLTVPLGWTHLMEDVLWVRYPHPPLVAIPKRLRTITCQLHEAAVQLEEELLINVTISVDFLHLLFVRITFVNETLTLTLEKYADVRLSYHPKRSFIAGLRHLSHYLLGTAIDSDGLELREKYT